MDGSFPIPAKRRSVCRRCGAIAFSTPRPKTRSTVSRNWRHRCAARSLARSILSIPTGYGSSAGRELSQPRAATSFCAHIILADAVLVVPDARQDPRFRDNRYVAGEPYIRFYAAAPLLTREGHRLGVLAIVDREPRRDFSDQNCKQLQTLARLVMNELDLRLELARAAAPSAISSWSTS